MMKTFKNVVEGMGLGILSDTVLAGLGVGFKKTKSAVDSKFKGSGPTPQGTVVDEMAKSREIQRIKTGRVQSNGSKADQARLKEIEKQFSINTDVIDITPED